MIPKFIYDKSQTTLVDIPIVDRLYEYRISLHNDFYNKLNILKIQRDTLIKNYFITIKEIDLEIKRLQSLNKGDKKENKT